MTIKILLFDIDGVLIDDTKVFYHSIENICKLCKEDFMKFYNSDYKKTWVDEIDLKESLEIWIKKWNLNFSVDEFLQIWFKSENRPNKELIDYIKKFDNIFLATTQEKYRTKYILEEMKFNQFTKEVFASYMFKVRKPDLKFYEKVFENLKKYYPNLKPQEILFFDDLIVNVEGAKKFGFKAFEYKNFENCKKIIEEKLN